jgi:hypothetical protein
VDIWRVWVAVFKPVDRVKFPNFCVFFQPIKMITDNEKLASTVMNAYHREMEIYAYQVNIDNYSAMLLALPSGDWPQDWVAFKGVKVEDLPHSLSDDDVQAISDYQYRDRLRSLVRTEKAEQNKSSRIRDVLKAQIGDDYDALVLAYKATQP